MKRLFLIFVTCVLWFTGFGQTKEVPFTLDDRDRLIKVEERLNSIEERINSMEKELNGKITSLRNEMNTRFEAIDKKLDILYWGFGLVITLILFLFGYIIFDRRNTIRPLEQDVSVIKYRQDNLSSVIKEFAKKDKTFAEALKKVAF